MLGECKPMKQWEIMGELRKRIKIRLDAEGIEIPFPHQTVYWGEAQPPFRSEYNAATPATAPVPTPQASREAVGPLSPSESIEDDDGIITPERREEQLASMAMAAHARVAEADPDVRKHTMLIDTDDNE
jgi:hypothetical protein